MKMEITEAVPQNLEDGRGLAAFVVQKVSRAGVRLRGLGCGWTAEPDADADGAATPDAKAS
jgi:hypothetical protein